jgi:hypothetical protein
MQRLRAALTVFLLALAGTAFAVTHVDSYIEGYSDVVSVAQGGTINFKVHSPNGSYTLEILHYFSLSSEVFLTASGLAGQSQTYEDDAAVNGANWATSYSLQVPSGWPSGLYSARLSDNAGSFEIPFIVKQSNPGSGMARVLLVASTNTWQAYNCWGGTSLYTDRNPPRSFGCGAQGGSAAFCDNTNCDYIVSTQRPYAYSISKEGVNGGHLWSGEKHLIRWLSDNAYSYAMAADIDVHSDPSLLSKYGVVIISTHSEYWTEPMYDNLSAFLSQGGTVFQLSGNTVYWKAVINGDRIEVRKDETPHTFANSGQTGQLGGQWASANVNRPPAALLGIQYTRTVCGGGNPSAPLTVVTADSFAFRNTGLSAGHQLGASGGSICGPGLSAWEMDTYLPALAPANTVVLAKGDNAPGADMVYYLHPGGGFVFALGSIESGRIANSDSVLALVLRNMMTNAGVPGAGWRPYFGDFNGDGIVDVLWDQADGYQRSAGVRLLWFGTASGRFTVKTNFNAQNNAYVGWRPYVGDFDGDGKADILWDYAYMNGNSAGSRNLWTSVGDGTFTVTGNVLGQNGYYNGWRPYIGDFNGDGKADILWDSCDGYGRSAGNRYLWTNQGTGSFSVTTNVNGVDGYYIGYRPYVGDFDGDGKADILWDYSDASGNSAGYRNLWTSAGDGTFTVTGNVSGQNGYYIGWRPYIGDFNGDGKADILWDNAYVNGSSAGYRNLWTSQGNANFDLSPNVNGANGYYVGWMPVVADLNADQKKDLLWYVNDGYARIGGILRAWYGGPLPFPVLPY